MGIVLGWVGDGQVRRAEGRGGAARRAPPRGEAHSANPESLGLGQGERGVAAPSPSSQGEEGYLCFCPEITNWGPCAPPGHGSRVHGWLGAHAHVRSCASLSLGRGPACVRLVCVAACACALPVGLPQRGAAGASLRLW